MRTGGRLGTGVVVTEDAAVHGRRLAMEPTGHYVTTFGGHEVPFVGMEVPSLPGVFGQIGCFQWVGDSDLP